ncbi:MAG: hypothetical protein V3R67_08755, partial [Thermodesulfobacteriota bacterium]
MTKETLLSFHGDVNIKNQLIKNLEMHKEMDNFRQGIYFENGKGCAVGCSIADFGGITSLHAEYERLFGIPRVLAKIEDGIFEGLSADDSKDWPINFIKSIPVGVDISLISDRFLHWLLVDLRENIKISNPTAFNKVIELCERKISGEVVSSDEWRAAAAYADADAA